MVVIFLLLISLAYPVSYNFFTKYFHYKNKIELEKIEIMSKNYISGRVKKKNDNSITISTFIGRNIELEIVVDNTTKIFTHIFILTKKNKIAQKDISLSDIEVKDYIKVISRDIIGENKILYAKSINVFKNE